MNTDSTASTIEEPLSAAYKNKVFNFDTPPSKNVADSTGMNLSVWEEIDKKIKESIDAHAVTGTQRSGKLYVVSAFNADKMSKADKKMNVFIRDVGNRMVIEEGGNTEDKNILPRYWKKSESSELIQKVRQKNKSALIFDEVSRSEAENLLTKEWFLIRMADMQKAGFAKYKSTNELEAGKEQTNTSEAVKVIVRAGSETFLKVNSGDQILFQDEKDQRLSADQIKEKIMENRVGDARIDENKNIAFVLNNKNFLLSGGNDDATGVTEIPIQCNHNVSDSFTSEDFNEHKLTVSIIFANLAQMARDRVLEATSFDSNRNFSFGSTKEEIQKNMAITEVVDNLIDLNGTQKMSFIVEPKERLFFVTPIVTKGGKRISGLRKIIRHGMSTVVNDFVKLAGGNEVISWLNLYESKNDKELTKRLDAEFLDSSSEFTFFDELRGFVQVYNLLKSKQQYV